MARPPSLFVKLAVRLAGVTVVLVAALLAVLAWRLDGVIDDLQDRTLTRQARDIAAHVVAGEGGLTVVLPPSLEASYRQAAETGRASFVVLDAAGRVIGSSPGVDAPLAPDFVSLVPGEEHFFAQPRQGGAPGFAGVALGIDIGDAVVVVQAAQSEDHGDVLFDTVLEEFADEHGWVVILFIVALIAITFATVRGTLRPVRLASDLALRISPGDADARLPVADMPREVLPLIEAVNRAFERLQKGIAVQRSFTADAAHQLRTPLAILNAQIDHLDDAVARRRLKSDVAVMNRIVAQLLHAAQAETLSLPADAQADLADVAREVATFLAPIAVEAGVTIDLVGGEGGPVAVRGHREALVNAVRNLVENAIGHAPRGSAVEIVLERPSTIHVIDHGPGVPPGDRANVVKRFWRADRSTNGAGLGLAIVAQIAEAHDARLEIGDAPADEQGRRGAMFSLRLHPAGAR